MQGIWKKVGKVPIKIDSTSPIDEVPLRTWVIVGQRDNDCRFVICVFEVDEILCLCADSLIILVILEISAKRRIRIYAHIPICIAKTKVKIVDRGISEQHTNNWTPIRDLVGRCHINNCLNIVFPGSFPVGSVGAKCARNFGSRPMSDTSSTRFRIYILRKNLRNVCV